MAAPIAIGKSLFIKSRINMSFLRQKGRIWPSSFLQRNFMNNLKVYTDATASPAPVLWLKGKGKVHRRHMCKDVTTSERTFIDTYSTVRALEESGFKTAEAECITFILLDIMQKNSELNQKELVSREQQEIVIQQVMSHIASVKKDMVILEKSEFSALRSQNEKLAIEMKQIKQHLADEIEKLANTVKLDINLEKSRSMEMTAGHHQEVEKVSQSIRTEVANMTAKLEATKTDTIKYFAGTMLGCITLGLGFYRILLM